MSDTKEEVMSTRRTRLSALRSEENSHCNDASGDEIVRCNFFAPNCSRTVMLKHASNANNKQR